jgi:hypothetical protein
LLLRASNSNVAPVTPTDLFLTQVLRRDWDKSAPDLPVAYLDWTELVRKALQHGVAGLLCRVLQEMPDDEIPEEIVQAAQSYLERSEQEGSARTAQTLQVVDVLQADGIKALPFKGVTLAVMAHGCPWIRPSRDIDVLVHKKDMDRAIVTLEKLGYRPPDAFAPQIAAAYHASNGQAILFADDRVPVEPHWAFAPSTFAVDLDIAGMWDRGTTLNIAGRAVPCLAPEDTLLVACMHGAKEKWWHLLWIADLAAFVHRHPTLDWKAIVERASVAGILRMLLLGLGLARTLFAAELPDSIGHSIKRDPHCRRLIETTTRSLFDNGNDPGSLFEFSMYHWHVRERAGDRIRYLLRTITTPQLKHYRMVSLPRPLMFGYVAVKVVHDYVLLPLWLLIKGHGANRGARENRTR